MVYIVIKQRNTLAAKTFGDSLTMCKEICFVVLTYGNLFRKLSHWMVRLASKLEGKCQWQTHMRLSHLIRPLTPSMIGQSFYLVQPDSIVRRCWSIDSWSVDCFKHSLCHANHWPSFEFILCTSRSSVVFCQIHPAMVRFLLELSDMLKFDLSISFSDQIPVGQWLLISLLLIPFATGLLNNLQQ